MKLSEELKAVKEKGFSKSHWLEIVIEKAEALETELIEEREKHETQIKAMKCCGNCQHSLLKNVTTRCVDCDDFNLWQEE